MSSRRKPETQGALDLVALIQASAAMGLEIGSLSIGRDGHHVFAHLYTPDTLRGDRPSHLGSWGVYITGPWAGDRGMVSASGLGIDVAVRSGVMNAARVRDYEAGGYHGNAAPEREAAHVKLAEILALKAGGA